MVSLPNKESPQIWRSCMKMFAQVDGCKEIVQLLGICFSAVLYNYLLC